MTLLIYTGYHTFANFGIYFMNRKSALLLFLFSILFFWNPETGICGEKKQKLVKNAGRIKNSIVLIPPVIPDVFLLEQFDQKGKTETKAEYLANIKEANANIKAIMKDSFLFAPVLFVDTIQGISDPNRYVEILSSFSKDSFFVFQFGSSAQYAEKPFKKIDNYHRNVVGIYETDCKTRVFLGEGDSGLFWKYDHALRCIQSLRKYLRNYYKVDNRKKNKKRPQKP